MNNDQEQAEPNNGSSLSYHIELLEYQKRISNILESFTDAFFEVTADWQITYWNKEAERLFLISRNEIIGKNLWEIYPEAISLKFYSEYHKALLNNVPVRFEEYLHPKEIWLEVAAFPNGKGLIVYLKDITERKNSAKLLEIEKKKCNDLFNLSPLPKWVYDLDSLNFLDVNEVAIEHYGYTRQEFLSMTIDQIRPKEDLSYLTEILQNKVSIGFPNKSYGRHQKKNGVIIDVIVEGNSVVFDDKNARMVMVMDRTKEVEAITALESSVARFDTVSKATSDAIWDLNMQTGEMIWNQGIRGIFGYKKTSYDEFWWKSRVHPDDLELLTQKRDQLIKNNENRLSLEYRFKRANGSYSFVLDRSFVLFDDNGKAIRMIGSMQDVSERIEHIKAIEAQNEKLKEIAWLQTHMVRGPLSNILGLTTLFDLENISVPELQEIIQLLKLAAANMDTALRKIVSKA